jgi:AraC-like DNA-binding protein
VRRRRGQAGRHRLACGRRDARVSAVARTLAVSSRTLARLFAEHLGYAPRTYLRLRRVGAVAEALEQEAWTAEARAGAGTRASHGGVGGRASRSARTVESEAACPSTATEQGRGAGAPPGARGGPAPAWRVRRPATLSEVAFRVGYSDHAHMTREFTRVMGTPPSLYRRDARETPLVRRFAPVAFERTVPWGGIGRAAGVADERVGADGVR